MNNKYMMMANQLMNAGYKPNGIGMQLGDPTAMTFNMPSLAKPMPQVMQKPGTSKIMFRNDIGSRGFRR